ncbi:alpha/beta hydrolase [Pseudonocardia broussonetiae]|uniref:Alpha/beta hydrolase n=1 Tax=Pseudonocardia broussonetiae TaxID=2736640 RepID=A0A6M6JQC0_9PSEU|nr:alpha/beta hydrolase [Pseudonocardia broussonetiae]
MGHSSSGCIGLQAALEEPDLITGLVLLEPAPKPAGPSADEVNARVLGPVMAALATGDVAGAADLFLRGVDGPDHRALLRARLGEDAPDWLVRDAAFFFADEIRAAAVDWDIDAVTAARIRARTLLVAGAESRTPMFAEAVAMLAGWLPDATAVELPGVGHGMTLQDPAAVARLVADFVRG